jgi:hypothetical protein
MKENDVAAMCLALSAALRSPSRKLRPATVSRALGVSPAAVEEFAYGAAQLSPDALRALAAMLRSGPAKAAGEAAIGGCPYPRKRRATTTIPARCRRLEAPPKGRRNGFCKRAAARKADEGGNRQAKATRCQCARGKMPATHETTRIRTMSARTMCAMR